MLKSYFFISFIKDWIRFLKSLVCKRRFECPPAATKGSLTTIHLSLSPRRWRWGRPRLWGLGKAISGNVSWTHSLHRCLSLSGWCTCGIYQRMQSDIRAQMFITELHTYTGKKQQTVPRANSNRRMCGSFIEWETRQPLRFMFSRNIYCHEKMLTI